MIVSYFALTVFTKFPKESNSGLVFPHLLKVRNHCTIYIFLTIFTFTETNDNKGRGHHSLHLDAVTLGALRRKSQAEMSKLRSREAILLLSKEPTILVPGPATFGLFRNSRSFDMTDLSQVMNIANSALELAIATRAFKDR